MRILKKIEDSCAVVALTYASQIDQETVLRVCTLHGFEVGYGMEDQEWQDSARELGLKFRAVSLKPCRLRSFIKKYNTGLYFVGTINHIFCVDNGLVIDPRYDGDTDGMGRIIKQAWKVDK